MEKSEIEKMKIGNHKAHVVGSPRDKCRMQGVAEKSRESRRCKTCRVEAWPQVMFRGV